MKKRVLCFVTSLICLFSLSIHCFAISDIDVSVNGTLYLPKVDSFVGTNNYFVYKRTADGFIFLITYNYNSYFYSGNDGVTFACSSLGSTFLRTRYKLNDNFQWEFVDTISLNLVNSSAPSVGAFNVYYSNVNIPYGSRTSTQIAVASGGNVQFVNAYSDIPFDDSEEQTEISNNILTNIKNVVSKVGGIFDKIGEGFTAVGNKLGDLGTALGDKITYLGNKLGELLSNLANKIGEGFNFLGDKIASLGTSILDGLKSLFIPKDGYFQGLWNKFKSAFDNKIPFISQLISLGGNIISTFNNFSSTTLPNFEITLYDTTVTVWDWEWFDKYRTQIQSIILALVYIPWFFKMYHSLPGIIRGLPGSFNYSPSSGSSKDDKGGD